MRRRNSKTHEKLEFWQSYSDMMSALLLVFALMLSGTLLKARQVYEADHASLEQQQIQLNDQKNQLVYQQDLIDQQQQQLEAIIGVRGELIAALIDEFKDSAYTVKIDQQTGAIQFDSNLLFDSSKFDLKPEGREFLEAFMPKYLDVLLGEKFLPYVAEIIIEGHTDDVSTYMRNLELSQNRALEVAKYCLNNESGFLTKEEIELLRQLLTANGRSESALIYEDDGVTVNRPASRRVELKFRLKDDEMIEQMIRLLEDNS